MPKFTVSYEQSLSTWNQENKSTRTTEVEFPRKPSRKDFPEIERMLVDKFFHLHKGNLKNLADVSYKINRVIG